MRGQQNIKTTIQVQYTGFYSALQHVAAVNVSRHHVDIGFYSSFCDQRICTAVESLFKAQ